MPNQLFNQLSGGNNNMFYQMMQFMAQNKGKNPRDEVNRMLQSGQITQNQFNEFWNKAQSMKSMFGGIFK